MLIRSPKSLDVSRRKLLSGGAALAAMAALPGQAQSPCGNFSAASMISPAAQALGWVTQWGDDFTTNTIDYTGGSNPKSNWFMRQDIGAVPANAVVDTTATASPWQFASPLGGILRINDANFPGDGNVLLSSTPPSTQGKSNPGFGCWTQGAWRFGMKMNTQCVAVNQWYAVWFDTQLFGSSPGLEELDVEEEFCHNGGFNLDGEITGGGHQWPSSGGNQVAAGGGDYGTLVNGTFNRLIFDSNYHVWDYLLVQTSSNTGYIQTYFDNQLLYIYNNGNPTTKILTGVGGTAGFQWVSNGNQPVYLKLGGPPTAEFDFDYIFYSGPTS